MSTPELSASQRSEIVDYLNDLHEMIAGSGRHSDHEQEKHGRCLYCSCGMRAQVGSEDA